MSTIEDQLEKVTLVLEVLFETIADGQNGIIHLARWLKAENEALFDELLIALGQEAEE